MSKLVAKFTGKEDYKFGDISKAAFAKGKDAVKGVKGAYSSAVVMAKNDIAAENHGEMADVRVALTIPNVNFYQIDFVKKCRVPIGNDTLQIIVGTSLEDGVEVAFLEGSAVDFRVPLCREAPVVALTNEIYVVAGPNTQYFAVEFPAETPEEVMRELSELLNTFAGFNIAQVGSDWTAAVTNAEGAEIQAPTSAGNAASKVEVGSHVAKIAIVSAATGVGSGIRKSGLLLKSKLKPRDRPMEVDDKWKSRVNSAAKVTRGAAVISKGILASVQTAAKAVANEIGKAINKSSHAQANPKAVEGAKTVLKSGVEAAGTVWDGCQTALKIIVNETTGTTAELVQHKYGEEAGKVAADCGTVINNIRETGSNMSGLGVKALAKHTAKQSVVSTVQGPRITEITDENEADATAMMSAMQLAAKAGAASGSK